MRFVKEYLKSTDIYTFRIVFTHPDTRPESHIGSIEVDLS